ncbi:hypothetical protein PEKONANI_01877 [Aeromonas jandaei]
MAPLFYCAIFFALELRSCWGSFESTNKPNWYSAQALVAEKRVNPETS